MTLDFSRIRAAMSGEYPGRKLRDYQVDAVQAVEVAHKTGTPRAAVVLPTGTGKSTVIAALAYQNYRRGERTLLMAHRGELLTQLSDSVAAVAADDNLVGVVQAERNELDRPIIAATVQTIYKDERLRQLVEAGDVYGHGKLSLVMVDEAHRAVADTYVRVLAGLGCFDGGARAAGFTATLSRGDDRRLGDVWEEVVYRKSIQWAIDEGHLVQPHGKAVVLENMDLGKVKRTGGDFQDGALGEVIGAHAGDIARTWREYASDRKTMVFVPSVDAAYEVAEALQGEGAKPAVVVGQTSRPERDAIYQAFRDGHLNVLVSVSVLTEGFDEPTVNCVLMARPTSLHHVYVQAAGRGLRPADWVGKTDCLILDVVGVSHRYPLTTLEDLGVDLPEPYKRVNPDGEELPEEDEGGELPPAQLRHVDQMVDVDLFALSPTVWLHTHRGTRFVPLREWVMFLWPVEYGGETLYQPGIIRNKAPWTPAERLGDGRPYYLEDAKLYVEKLAHELDPATTNRGASWRERRQPATSGQIRYAKRLGVANPERFTKAALSDAMEILVASRLLDR